MQRMISKPILEYGAQPRWNLRRVVVKALAALALIVLVGISGLFVLVWFYIAPERELRNHLSSIPGVVAVEIKTLDDRPTVQILSAEIALTGTRREFELQSPYVEFMIDGSHLNIRRIGPYGLRAIRDDRREGSVNVGSKGEFRNWLPTPIRDMTDLVARYDEVLEFARKSEGVSKHVGTDGRAYELQIYRRW